MNDDDNECRCQRRACREPERASPNWSGELACSVTHAHTDV
jgi:hypothetical protein